jgi:hypothetical protein
LKLTISTYYNNESGEYLTTKFYIDGEECSEEEYCEILEDLNNINNEVDCDGNCEECPNNKYEQEQEENQFLRAVTDAVNDTLEMFEDENTCDDCKFEALMGLVFLGVNGALQGCVIKDSGFN